MGVDVNKLYPLLTEKIEIEKTWGSESWILSGLDGKESLVSNGFLAENGINDVLDTYMTDFVGDKIFEQYPLFPLLVKILEVKDFLSVQVHPSDEIAVHEYDCWGKTEMWYILEASAKSKLFIGLNRDIDGEEFYERCSNGTICEVMNQITPKAGECYLIPAGTLHACGGGIKIAEVQQSSEVTFRVYDWGRENNPQTAREMHLAEAMECMSFKKFEILKKERKSGEIIAECPYFRTIYKELDKPVSMDNSNFNSLLLYIGVEGDSVLEHKGQEYMIGKGEILILPADINEWSMRGACGKSSAVLQVDIIPSNDYRVEEDEDGEKVFDDYTHEYDKKHPDECHCHDHDDECHCHDHDDECHCHDHECC